jgi:iron complex outermembrane receptor protein
VFLSGQNLLLFTKYSGQDPEVNTNKQINGVPSFGVDYTAYPRAKTVTFGASISF